MLNAINAVWQQGTQTISGGTFSASFLVTGLKQYATYYLETRRAGSFYSPKVDANYWCDWDCVNPWACVTPLS